jgi:hypothetical protein
MLSVVRLLLDRLIGNSMVVSVIMVLVQNLISYGNKIAPKALVYIIEASGSDMNNAEKLATVLSKLQNDFPDVGASFLRTVIETTYDAWDAGKLN